MGATAKKTTKAGILIFIQVPLGMVNQIHDGLGHKFEGMFDVHRGVVGMR